MDDKFDKKSPPASPSASDRPSQGGPAKKPQKESVSYTKSSNQDPIGNISDRMRGVFSNRTTAIFAVVVLLVGLGAATIATQRSTETRQRASSSPTPFPGTCLVLPQEFCGSGKIVTDPMGEFFGLGFDLPDNTPIFAYDNGVLTSSFLNVATSTYRGVSLSTKTAINANTYFKDSITAGTEAVSKDVKKGEILGYTHKDPQNPYDLLINFSKLGKNTITIDQQFTKTNFGL